MENIDFLQSEEWRKFQEATGKRTFRIDGVSVIEHNLPIVGNYFYVPREEFSGEIIKLAKKEKAGWIRIDPKNKNFLENIRAFKAPHDMQPREVLVIDITKSVEELLGEMKSKTRYNLKLAEKKNVKVISKSVSQLTSNEVNEFLRLVKATAERKKIKFHPEDYYRKMIETINSDMLSLYIAEYEGKTIAANLVVFYENTATYLHGATDDDYRNVMAPYLLQWQAIKDAKNKGFKFYDFGGVKTGDKSNWIGITKFKLGFSPNTKIIEFPGSWDIVVNPARYWAYRSIQKLKSLV